METRLLTQHWDDEAHASVEGYVANGGYEAMQKALRMEPDAIIEEVKASQLRGRGGAGFPTGLKWGFIPKSTDKPVYVVCNADESEPGTFKDRAIIHKDPHSMLEGMVICGKAVGSHAAFIYIRGEFVDEARRVQKAVDEAYEGGFLGKDICGTGFDFDILVHRGAGAYICGEETALLESLEGKKGQPRNKPPFPANVGAFGCPTVINNVETFSTVPWIINHGGAAYASYGTDKSKGTKLVGISGPVKKPGVYEVEMGYPLRKFIMELAGGMQDGKRLLGVIPGGTSTPPLHAEDLSQVNLSFESLEDYSSALGTAGIIVLPEDFSVVEMLKVITRFYADESCGQCVPCREGTGWLYKLMKRMEAGKGSQQDIRMLQSISEGMEGRTICALADAAAWPTKGFLRVFRQRFLDVVTK